MKALIDVYGVKLAPTATGVENTSVGAYLQSRLKRPEPGDRDRLGSVVLIVRAIDERNKITAIGLSFD